jgi:sugar phosphate isomerase/epimerase
MTQLRRIGATPLRLSLAAYSLRERLERRPGDPQGIDLMRFAELAAEWGFDAVELTSYYFPSADVDEFVHRLKRHCFLLGLDVSGGAVRNNFTLGEGEELEREFAHVQRWVDLYAELGAPVIRVFAGEPPPGMSESVAVENSVRNLRRACESAGRRGVTLAIENHDFLMNPDRILEIVRSVDSPWFGVNWDSGNLPTKDPYGDLERLAPFAVNAQVKVEIRGPSGAPVPADLSRIVAILRGANYRGYLVLEHEAKEDPMTAIPNYSARLRELIDS